LAAVLEAQAPTAPAASEAQFIAEIRTHGNARLADEEVIRLTGLEVGQRLNENTLTEVERRLQKSGHFDSIEIRKRYRSLEDFSQVALLLVVHERIEGKGNAITRPLRKIRSRVMFLPILTYRDGYGWTYGVRSSTVDTLGFGERLSVPLTWGATKRAALELERSFESGPLTRIQSSIGISNETNPRFLLTDQRVELKARAERRIGIVRLGVDGGRTKVDFGTTHESFWAYGANAAIDTRADPKFPSNAVYAFAGWRGLERNGGQARIGIVEGDLRGYWRFARQAVVAAHLNYEGADRRLPDYERLLLGGAPLLRGTRVASADGDRLIAASTELRIPITSPLRFGRFGGTLFFDAAKTYDVGQRPSSAPWSRGAGVGLFMIVQFMSVNLHFAHSLDGDGGRVHLSTGFTF
jgi:outer membrane protein assembly factor BamA